LSPSLPAFVLEDGSLTYTGEYRQKLLDARVDHKLTPKQTLMFRYNLDQMFDTNPNDAVINTTAPSAARRYTRRGWSTQVNYTSVLSTTLLNEARVSYTNGDPRDALGADRGAGHLSPRRALAPCRLRSATIGSPICTAGRCRSRTR
jgi:hypothetical protein